MKKKETGISGAVLKWIAVISMLIDHASLVIYFPLFKSRFSKDSVYEILYIFFRVIGRIAFPLFAFLIIEGLIYTRSRGRYICKLLLFALVSEVPFDLCFLGSAYSPERQNVFFTLFIGASMIIISERIRTLVHTKKKSILWYYCGMLILSSVGMILSWLLRTDYSYVGVLCLILMWILQNDKMTATGIGFVTLILAGSIECFASLALVPVFLYNGKRGTQNKYFFYWFYPVHLLIFWLVVLLIKN